MSDESTPGACARTIINDKFGRARFAELTGYPRQNIDHWMKVGIPEKHRARILLVARENGIEHTPADYVAYLDDLLDSQAA